jgi:hypothetical protein
MIFSESPVFIGVALLEELPRDAWHFMTKWLLCQFYSGNLLEF